MIYDIDPVRRLVTADEFDIVSQKLQAKRAWLSSTYPDTELSRSSTVSFRDPVFALRALDIKIDTLIIFLRIKVIESNK